jgi:hypothetical protein
MVAGSDRSSNDPMKKTIEDHTTDYVVSLLLAT